MRGDHAGKCYCWHLINKRQFSIVISIENEGGIPKLPTVYPEQSSKGSERAQLTHMPESCSDQDIHDHASCKGKENRKCKVQQKTLHSQNPILCRPPLPSHPWSGRETDNYWQAAVIFVCSSWATSPPSCCPFCAASSSCHTHNIHMGQSFFDLLHFRWWQFHIHRIKFFFYPLFFRCTRNWHQIWLQTGYYSPRMVNSSIRLPVRSGT